MNVCIVKEDNVVVVDGEGINFDFTIADNIWAIQWNGSQGEIEYNDGTPNLLISGFSDYQYLVDAHATEKQRLVDVAVQEEADRVANMTYAEKRAEAYPSLEEQADMQFHDAVDGTTTWKDAIQAVKDTYPKP